jgi:hypothetical protein
VNKRVNIPPWGKISPLGAKFTPGGEFKNGPQHATFIAIPSDDGATTATLAKPDEWVPLDRLEQKLTGAAWSRVLSKLRPQKLTVRIPVMEIRSGEINWAQKRGEDHRVLLLFPS